MLFWCWLWLHYEQYYDCGWCFALEIEEEEGEEGEAREEGIKREEGEGTQGEAESVHWDGGGDDPLQRTAPRFFGRHASCVQTAGKFKGLPEGNFKRWPPFHNLGGSRCRTVLVLACISQGWNWLSLSNCGSNSLAWKGNSELINISAGFLSTWISHCIFSLCLTNCAPDTCFCVTVCALHI